MTRLYIDLETRWQPDLKKHGAARCAAHETAGINCIGWAVDDGPVQMVKYEGCTSKEDLIQALLNDPNIDPNWQAWYRQELEHSASAFDGLKVVAHNAQFEMTVLKQVLGVVVPPSRWIDTMAKAAYYGYPRSLDGAAQALGCDKLKDVQGKGVMLKLVKGIYTPEDCPDDFERLYTYCSIDVEVCREIDSKLPDLPPFIQRIWELDAAINQRGVPVDLVAIENAIQLKKHLAAQADDEMARITNGFVTAIGQTKKLQEWLTDDQGVFMVDCTADTVVRTLERADLPPRARQALALRKASGLSSLAKYEKMLDYAVDGRLYLMFDFYGTGPGRWSGRGPQLQNLPRSTEPELWADAISKAPYLILQCSDPAQRLKDGIRGVISADPGFTFMGADLSQIQARGTGWAADCQRFLDLFAKGDPYCEYGRSLFGHEITKADLVKRTAAKASVLSMGFGGGIGAGQTSAEVYHLDLDVLANIILPTATPSEMMEGQRNVKYYLDKRPLKPLSESQALAVDIVKQRYRKDFAEIANFWDELEQAFLMGGWAGKRIHVEAKASGLRILTLPSGRQIFYHDVRVHQGGKYSYQDRDGRVFIWKGTLIENVALGIEYDAITFYMQLAEKEVGPIVHHAHDEFTLMVPKLTITEAEAQLKAIMARKPSWADGLPLKSDIWISERYGK